jgi:hypothetical protein
LHGSQGLLPRESLAMPLKRLLGLKQRLRLLVLKRLERFGLPSLFSFF